jgi:hypothetical protein
MGYDAGEAKRSAAVKMAANIRRAAAIAIAIDNAVRLVANYKDQRDIAQRSQDISEAQQNQIRTVFWPREEAFLAEFSTPEPIEDVEVMGRRYGGRLASTVAKQFADALKEAKCSFPRYCTSANSKVLQDLMMARSLAIANARVLGRNIAFAEYQARTDVNYNRRLQAVSLGRGLINEAMSLYAAAGRGLAGVGAELSAQFNSALEAFGYAARGPDARTFSQQAFTSAEGSRRPVSGAAGDDYLQTVNKYGFESSQQSFTNIDTSSAPFRGPDPTGLSEKARIPEQTALSKEHFNRGDVGPDNLVPQGTVVFPVESIFGGTVAVNLGEYMLQYVDDKSPGDFNTAS